MRKLSGVQFYVTYVYIVALGLFHLYTAAFGSFESYLQRNIHLGFVLPLAYWLFPATAKGDKTRIPFYDWGLGILSAIPCLYVIYNYDLIINRIQQVDELTAAQFYLGILLVLMLWEGTRRIVGLPLTVIAVLFTLYMLLGDQLPGLLRGLAFLPEEVVEQLYLTDEGIFSMPLGVSATFVMIFLIFGGFLEKSGAGDYFMELAQAFTGARPGGPAQIAVVSSCLLGSISGSAVANVYGTGAFTIPLMKRLGYPPYFAGAVEAVASSGGQIMPPVMGAGAFLMASFLGIQYREIIIAAFFPAILYYGTVLLMVRLAALKTGLRGLDPSELPSKKNVLKRSYMLLPIVGLVYFLMAGYTPMRAALIGIVLAWVVSLFNKRNRMGPREILDAVYQGAKGIPLVCVACASAGIVLGSVALTGIGGKLVGFVLSFSQGVPFLALVLVMLVSLVLGMGLPTTGAYILAAALGAPILIKLGFLPIAAHMFVFYYAIISNITPPVALAAYAASSIAGSGPNETGFKAMQLGFLAFVVPFAFCFDPGLLLQGDWVVNTFGVISGICVMFSLGFALMGYIDTPLNLVERLLLLGASVLVLTPFPSCIAAGALILAGVWIFSKKRPRINVEGLRA